MNIKGSANADLSGMRIVVAPESWIVNFGLDAVKKMLHDLGYECLELVTITAPSLASLDPQYYQRSSTARQVNWK